MPGKLSHSLVIMKYPQPAGQGRSEEGQHGNKEEQQGDKITPLPFLVRIIGHNTFTM